MECCNDGYIRKVSILGGIDLTATTAKFEIDEIDFDRFSSYRHDFRNSLDWQCLFVLPDWQRVWWRAFGGQSRLSIRCARQQGEVIGIAPLMVNGPRAALIGGADVCDYLDFIVRPAKADDFFNLLLDHLAQHGLSELDLIPLRADSTAICRLARIAEDRGCKVTLSPHDVSL